MNQKLNVDIENDGAGRDPGILRDEIGFIYTTSLEPREASNVRWKESKSTAGHRTCAGRGDHEKFILEYWFHGI